MDHRLAGVHATARNNKTSLLFSDHTAVYATLASVMVFLMVPARLLQLVLDHLLGKLSKGYAWQLCEDCSISKVCAAWASRLATSATVFRTPTDESRNS